MLPETIATICEQIVMSVFSAAAILQNDTYPVDPNLSELWATNSSLHGTVSSWTHNLSSCPATV